LLLSIAFMFVALPGINLLASLNALIPMPQWANDLEQKALEITKALLTTKYLCVYLANIFVIAVLPALGEELFFRGVLQPFATKLVRNSFWGIFITAFIFSAIHFQFQGFIPRLALGVMFGYLYLWSGSLWVPIAAHFVNNASATTIFYLIGQSKLPANTENIGELNQLWAIGALSIVAASTLGYYLWKERVNSLYVKAG
jgi:membrane protease YdiL (CAAX protease family)